MVVVVNLSSIKNIDKKAVVQYSYPIANITSSSSNVFSLRFNGFNPNFSASFKNTYISGVCIKATLFFVPSLFENRVLLFCIGLNSGTPAPNYSLKWL